MHPFHFLLATALTGASFVAAAGGSHGSHHARADQAAAPKEQTDWGIAGDLKAARRIITVTMADDMRFRPSIIEVGEGETVKFVVRNAGKVLHEMVIGTKKDLEEHAAMMKKFPGMEHDEPHMTHVRPGRNGAIVWNFNRPGTFLFACLVPGHYEAGMIGEIRVMPATAHKGHKD